jgi:hypothetical protein
MLFFVDYHKKIYLLLLFFEFALNVNNNLVAQNKSKFKNSRIAGKERTNKLKKYYELYRF